MRVGCCLRVRFSGVRKSHVLTLALLCEIRMQNAIKRGFGDISERE